MIRVLNMKFKLKSNSVRLHCPDTATPDSFLFGGASLSRVCLRRHAVHPTVKAQPTGLFQSFGNLDVTTRWMGDAR